MYISTYSGMFRNYSGIFRTLCNPCNFRTLIYSEPEAYAQPWHIQNPDIFKTLAYSEPVVYSEPCQISKMEHCTKIVNSFSFFCNISFHILYFFKIKVNFFLQNYIFYVKKYSDTKGWGP